MTETKPGGQSIRRAARQAAIAAQAKRRAQAAERDKRVDAAIKAMLAGGLTLADVVTWTDGETTLKEATRLADLAAAEVRP